MSDGMNNNTSNKILTYQHQQWLRESGDPCGLPLAPCGFLRVGNRNDQKDPYQSNTMYQTKSHVRVFTVTYMLIEIRKDIEQEPGTWPLFISFCHTGTITCFWHLSKKVQLPPLGALANRLHKGLQQLPRRSSTSLMYSYRPE